MYAGSIYQPEFRRGEVDQIREQVVVIGRGHGEAFAKPMLHTRIQPRYFFREKGRGGEGGVCKGMQRGELIGLPPAGFDGRILRHRQSGANPRSDLHVETRGLVDPEGYHRGHARGEVDQIAAAIDDAAIGTEPRGVEVINQRVIAPDFVCALGVEVALPFWSKVEHVLQSQPRSSETGGSEKAGLGTRRGIDVVENRRRVGMLAASEDVDIDACTPNFAELMLKDEACQEVARVAGLRNAENRKFRATSIFGEAGAVELDPARRPSHGGVWAADIVGGC